MNTEYIAASELAEFVYCECCWIDKIEGLQSETAAMHKGAAEHNKLYSQLRFLVLLKRVAIFLTLIGTILFLSQIILLFIYQTSLW